jgi:hypothetical protein
MSKRLKKFFQTSLSFVLIGALAWFIVWVGIQLLGLYRTLSDPLQTALITAVPVIAVAAITYFANKSLETKRSVEQALRPRKLELYEEFIGFLMTIFGNEKVVKRPDEKAIMQFFADKTPKLMTFASNKVIEKWGKMRMGLDKGSDEDRMFLVEDAINEIRIDLGHEKRGFHKGDILRLFVNDIDDFLKR